MLDKILTDEKTFRIFCLILFAILFFIVLRKNKKEKFSWTAPDTANKFKTQVETVLGDNLTAIKNLGELAGALQSGSDYIFPHNLTITGNLNVNGITALNGASTVKTNDLTKFHKRITDAQTKANSAHSLASGKTTSAEVDTKLAGYIKNNAKVNIYQDLVSGPTDLIRVDATTVIQHNDGGSYHNCTNPTNSAWVIKTCPP